MNTLKLKNKVSIITGATQGIGKAIAQKYASEGSGIAIIGRNGKKGKEVAQGIRDGHGVNSIFDSCDVANYQEVKKTTEAILADFGHVDILVCNAGWTINTPFESMDIEIWDKAISINLNGAFYFVRGLIGPMLKNKKGNIIFVGSSTTVTGSGGGVHYAASKAGLVGGS